MTCGGRFARPDHASGQEAASLNYCAYMDSEELVIDQTCKILCPTLL